MADENPFADPKDVNPFASQLSYVDQSKNNTNEYNPFADDSKTSTTTQPSATQPVFIPQPVATPATIEPTKSEPLYQTKPLPSSASGGYGTQDESMRRRQEELEKKAQDLERREEELRKLQGSVQKQNNFPPFPKFCKINPCFYHDISLEIPIESQRTCRMMFYTWQLYVFTLLFNFISALAGLCVSVPDGGVLFGVALLYLVIFTPCSFLLWYRPLYKALKSNSSFNFMLFFFVIFFQIIFAILYALGISQLGTAGWINGTKLIDIKEKAVAAMFFITAALFSLLAIVMIILLRKIHGTYRSSGASFQKAQSEFVTGVASNKNVQNAAADAVKAGVSSQGTRY